MRQLTSRATAIVLFLTTVSLPALAQEDEAAVGDKIRQMQSLVRAEFRQILHDEMMLTDDEKNAFWPLYERYSAESRVITDRYLAVVTEFVDRYYGGELSNDNANNLLDSYFETRLAVLKLRQAYLARFREVLGGIKVARLYQLENKVQAEVDVAFAAAIPLADPR